MLSDDQNILNMTKHYFKLCNDPKVSTPQKNRNQIEEEKSTVDTVFINKYSHLASGSPSRNPQSDHDVHINSFTKSAEKDPKFGLEEVVTTIFMMNQMNNN